MRCPKNNIIKAREAKTAPANEKQNDLKKTASKTPIADSVPAVNSTIVTVVTIIGKVPFKNVLEKYTVNHSKFPLRSNTLSKPDCKNRMAKNTETKACTIQKPFKAEIKPHSPIKQSMVIFKSD